MNRTVHELFYVIYNKFVIRKTRHIPNQLMVKKCYINGPLWSSVQQCEKVILLYILRCRPWVNRQECMSQQEPLQKQQSHPIPVLQEKIGPNTL